MSGHCFSSGRYNVWAGMSYLGRLVSCWRQRGLSQRRDGGLCLLVLVVFLAGLCGASMVAQAQSNVLHTFGVSPSDGATPVARLVRDAAGTLYGTTSAGTSPSTKGVVFKLRQTGAYTILHSFTGMGGTPTNDGATPVAPLVRDNAGNLYGTTQLGGSSDMGVVFQLSPTLSGPYIYTTLHSFSGADGATPQAGLIRDSAGNLYGTTSAGGSGVGVVFQLTPNGDGTYSYTTLHSFSVTDGATPQAGVIRDGAGNLYGTTSAGGSGVGVVFQLNLTTSVVTTLHSFTGGTNGATPQAGLFRDNAGNLYGTTSAGGSSNNGVVFKFQFTTATSGIYTTLYSFSGVDGATPEAELVRDLALNFYTTTSAGGASGKGVVFKLPFYLSLYGFGGADGAYPVAGLVRDAAGTLYGTTSAGGANGVGVVFKLSPPFPTATITTLYSFTGEADGGNPVAGLVRNDFTGTLYGTTEFGGPNGKGNVFLLRAN